MLIQWMVLTDWGWSPVGERDTQESFTEAFVRTGGTDVWTYTYHAPWTGRSFDYAVDFERMQQTNTRTNTTRPLRMQIVEVNTNAEARQLLLVGLGGVQRRGSASGGSGGWSTAPS